jgi:predicted 3-demethylubiquinone-9 3-methyltransferase (glyoxalase superfamily)
MNNRISTGLWFDSNAKEAAEFYTSVFTNSRIDLVTHYGKAGFEIHKRPAGSVMSVLFTLCGAKFHAINGGPLFKFNPSISFYTVCESAEETQTVWNKLVSGGQVLMALDKYDWAEKYGWLNDRYGMSWQISQGKISEVGQKITPLLMFVGAQAGRATEAIKFYTSIFDDSAVEALHNYPPGMNDPQTSIMHGRFKLAGQKFMAMDSNGPHKFNFNEAISMIVDCDNQKEIDYYWNKLTAGGEEGPCGWLKDKFGVSWQVEPLRLGEMLTDKDASKRERVTNAFLKMKKFDLTKLEEAFKGTVIS